MVRIFVVLQTGEVRPPEKSAGEDPASKDAAGTKDAVDGNPEPMETEEAPKEPDDGVVDVSGILKDIDDFNRSAEPTPESKTEGDQNMDVDETPTEASKPQSSGQTGEEGKEEEGPDTSQVIAALKNLESYDEVDSQESNEPEQFSEDIVDEEKAPDAEGSGEAKDKKEATEVEKEETNEAKESNDKEVCVHLHRSLLFNSRLNPSCFLEFCQQVARPFLCRSSRCPWKVRKSKLLTRLPKKRIRYELTSLLCSSLPGLRSLCIWLSNNRKQSPFTFRIRPTKEP